MNIENKPSNTKEEYEAPALEELGSVAELTQGPTSGFEDGFGSGSGPI